MASCGSIRWRLICRKVISSDAQRGCDAGQPAGGAAAARPALALEPLLAAMGKPDYITGNLEVQADLRGAGATPHAIAASLNGTLGAGAGERHGGQPAAGQHAGIGAARGECARSGGRGGTSQVQCFAARLDANHGIATVRSLVLASSLLTWMGRAALNLAAETLDLRLRPQGRVAGTGWSCRCGSPGRCGRRPPRRTQRRRWLQNAGTVAGAVLGNSDAAWSDRRRARR